MIADSMIFWNLPVYLPATVLGMRDTVVTCYSTINIPNRVPSILSSPLFSIIPQSPNHQHPFIYDCSSSSPPPSPPAWWRIHVQRKWVVSRENDLWRTIRIYHRKCVAPVRMYRSRRCPQQVMIPRHDIDIFGNHVWGKLRTNMIGSLPSLLIVSHEWS